MLWSILWAVAKETEIQGFILQTLYKLVTDDIEILEKYILL